MSGQIIVGAGTATGSLKLQVSNDQAVAGNLATNYAPANWSDLGAATSITTAGLTLISPVDMCYRWLRATYADNFFRINTVTTVADTAGSLNSKYFLFNSVTVAYYVWFDNGAGVDPAIAGRTGVHVTYTNGDSANTIGGLLRAALGNPADYTVSGANNQAIITNDAVGASAAAVDGAAATGFTFAFTQPTASITVQVEVQGF